MMGSEPLGIVMDLEFDWVTFYCAGPSSLLPCRLLSRHAVEAGWAST